MNKLVLIASAFTALAHLGIDAWQLQRWRERYPVPTNLRSPSLAAAEAARAAAAAADAGRT